MNSYIGLRLCLTNGHEIRAIYTSKEVRTIIDDWEAQVSTFLKGNSPPMGNLPGFVWSVRSNEVIAIHTFAFNPNQVPAGTGWGSGLN